VGAEMAFTEKKSEKAKTEKNKQEDFLGSSSWFLSGDIKKTNVRDQLFFGINFDGFLNIFNTYPFIVAVPTVKGENAVAVPICRLVHKYWGLAFLTMTFNFH
jgi:hypothetical protein